MTNIWKKGVKKPEFPQLKTSIEADVTIIGGGITGITCAYLLSKSGKKVVLVEKKALGSGATEYTTAFATESIDTDLYKLVDMYGRKKTKLISESHQYAIDLIEKTVKDNKIECEFKRCSNYIYANNEEELEGLEEEKEMAKSLGIKMKFKKDSYLKFKNYGYLQVPDQAKFHPLKYIFSLAKISQRQGAKIFEKTEGKEITGNGPFTLKTSSGSIKTKYIIMATYSPFNKELAFKKAFYTSYVFELQIPKNSLKEGLYEDSKNPYHYFRVDPKKESQRLIIGGEDHRSDIPVSETKSFKALEDYAKQLLPSINYKIISKWTGQIMESVDGLPFIGPYKNRGIFHATGFSGNGITYSMIAAKIISNQITGKKDSKVGEFASIYNAKRSPTLKQLLSKAPDYIGIFFNGAVKNTLKFSLQ